MLELMTMPATPLAIIDALNSLAEAEQNSIFRFMGEGSPYLGRAGAEIRRPLQQMVLTSHRRCGQLAAAVEALGGVPRPRGIQPEEQYLAFLSLEILLPKLVDAKKLGIRRYENALKAIGTDSPQIIALLSGHPEEQRSELIALEKATRPDHKRG
jgi:hypothetical protein